MVPTPKRGVSRNPASNAPIIPTRTLSMRPCCALVCMMMLAIHPRMPPTIIQTIKFIAPVLSVV
jgi:hypothetical protein